MSQQAIIQRLERLESQLAFQEDIINGLNELVSKQNQELSRYKRNLQLLAQRVEQLRDQPDDKSVDEPPPHY